MGFILKTSQLSITAVGAYVLTPSRVFLSHRGITEVARRSVWTLTHFLQLIEHTMTSKALITALCAVRAHFHFETLIARVACIVVADWFHWVYYIIAHASCQVLFDIYFFYFLLDFGLGLCYNARRKISRFTGLLPRGKPPHFLLGISL